MKEKVLSQESLNRMEELESLLSSHEQLELPTEHFFIEGVYCRRVFRPEGTAILGKVHKKEHLFMCAKGKIIVLNAETGENPVVLNAGDIVISKPGTKRATFAVVDSIGVTIHRTNALTVEDAELELVEDDPGSPFGVGNKLRVGVLES